jgi:hypothetical protein
MCALNSEVFKTIFTCNGGTTYDTDFKVFDEGDVEVIYISTAGVETTLTITSSYSISLITETGFRVTTVATYADGKLVARRNMDLKQEADWERNGSFSTDVLEKQLDKQIMMVQQLQEQLNRSILGASSQITSLTLPEASADKIIGWNGAGTALENKVAVDTDVAAAVTVSQVAAAASAAAAAISAAAAEAVAGWTVASQAEAEAGTDNTKVMTPLRVAQELATLAPVETAWTDYSATSTIVGWGSYTTKQVYYKKVGKVVFVAFNIEGTSNNAATTFTLPTNSASIVSIIAPIVVLDNNIRKALAYLSLAHGAATVTLSIDTDGTAWTASGNKAVYGLFWYEVA